MTDERTVICNNADGLSDFTRMKVGNEYVVLNVFRILNVEYCTIFDKANGMFMGSHKTSRFSFK